MSLKVKFFAFKFMRKRDCHQPNELLQAWFENRVQNISATKQVNANPYRNPTREENLSNKVTR